MVVGICDDDMVFAENFAGKLREVSKRYNISVQIEIFSDGRELLKEMERRQGLDLVYLDIEMGTANGIEIAKELRMISEYTILIYVTNYESFAREAFEVDAFRFLVKPVDSVLFEKYFLDAVKKLTKEKKYFQYSFNKKIRYLSIDEILYFQSEKRISWIMTKKETIKCYEKLNTIEKRLEKQGTCFYRIHQSFLINPEFIKKYQYDTVELKGDILLPISEKYRKKVGELFCSQKGEDIIGF